MMDKTHGDVREKGMFTRLNDQLAVHACNGNTKCGYVLLFM